VKEACPVFLTIQPIPSVFQTTMYHSFFVMFLLPKHVFCIAYLGFQSTHEGPHAQTISLHFVLMINHND
jgi:hypothetical protein